MDDIIAQAKEFGNVTTREPDDAVEVCSVDVDDERANIAEGSGSSDASDQDDDSDTDMKSKCTEDSDVEDTKFESD